MKKQVITMVLICAIVFSLIPHPVASAAENVPTGYGWQALSKLPDSGQLQYAYTQLVNGISDSSTSISLYDGAHTVSVAQMQTAMELVRSDHPEFFWLDSGYSYSTMGSAVFSVMPMYTMTGTQLEDAKDALEAVAEELLAGLRKKSDYAIAKLLHDRLAAHMSYQFTENDQTAYGALVERQAVCAGYASAYQYLLQQAGIPAWKVTGYSVSPGSGDTVGHAWNMVCLDGNWYHTDVTWDDQGGLEDIYYAYLNVTTDRIQEDHVMDDLFVSLAPVCSAVDANYFTVNGGIMERFDADTVAAIMRKTWHTARCYVTGDLNAFVSTWQQNVRTVAQKLGIFGGYTYGYRLLGREILLYIDDGTADPNPPEETFPDITEPEQTLPEETEPEVTVPEETVPEETKPGETPESMAGDFTGDSYVDNADVVFLLWHTLFPEDYPLAVSGDITNDGNVDNADVVFLLWHTLFPEDYPLTTD